MHEDDLTEARRLVAGRNLLGLLVGVLYLRLSLLPSVICLPAATVIDRSWYGKTGLVMYLLLLIYQEMIPVCTYQVCF